MEEYLTVKEVSQILKMGINKTYDLIAQKDFPKIKIGGRYLVPKSSFENYMKHNIYKEITI